MTVRGLASNNEKTKTALPAHVRVLVLGASGQLATALGNVSVPPEWEVERLGRGQADVTNAHQVDDVVGRTVPDIIINTAAFTDVDGAETEPDQAHAVNCEGAANVARAAAAQGIPILHISTDFVFSGAKETAYAEDDTVGPLGVYGTSKEAGECAIREITAAHAIVRTAWLYSAAEGNFVTSIIRHMQQSNALSVVHDQIGTPTYADDLAQALIAMAAQLLQPQNKHFGTFHAAGRGCVSRYDFAREIQADMTARLGARWSGASCEISPCLTASRSSPAVRPAFSALNCDKLETCYGIKFDRWQDSLKRCAALV